MKPLTLRLCNFCSYVGEDNLIDFTKFGPKGIYVITGPKGAGKSTIFDGITFALYGRKSNGLGREDVRSKYAPEEGETSVEFEFLYGEKRYFIKRSYKIRRKKTNNLDKSESVEIREYHGNEAEPKLYPGKTTDLNNIIENEIIKLTFDQFTQIVMLVQGDFKKLLRAKNDDKRAIFQKIFNTGRFAQYEREFELKSAALKAENGRERLKFVEKLKQINCPAEFSEADVLEAYRAVDFSDRFKETIELLRNIIQYQANVLEQYASKRDASQSYAKEFGERSSKAEQQAKLQNDIAELAKQMEAEEGPLKDAENELKEINATYGEKLGQFAQSLAAIEVQKKNLQALEQALENQKQVAKDIQSLETENKELEVGLTSMQGFLTANEDQIKALEKEIESRDVLARIGKQLEGQVNSIERAADELATLQQKQADLAAQEKSLGAKTGTAKEAVAAQEKLVQAAKDAALEVEKLRNAYKDFGMALNDAKAILEKGDKLDAAKAEVVKANAEYNATFTRMQEQELVSRRLEQIYKDSLAGLWALELEEGDPCPVCGSTEHPNKAQLTHKEIHEADVEKAKGALEALQKEANLAQANALHKKEEQEKLLAELMQAGKKLYQLETAEAILAHAAQEKKNSEARREEIKRQGAEAAATAKQQKDREDKLQELQQQYDKLTAQQTQLATHMGSNNGQIATTSKALRDAIFEATFEDDASNAEYEQLKLGVPEEEQMLLSYVPQLIAFHKEQLDAFAARTSANDAKINNRDALLLQNEQLKAKNDADSKKLTSNKMELGKLEGKIDGLNNNVAELQKLVREKKLADIRQEEAEVIKQRQGLVDAKDKAEKSYNSLNKAYEQQDARKKSLEDSLKELTAEGLELVAAEELKKMQADAEQEAATYNKEWIKLHTELELNQQILTQCQDKTEELERAEHLAQTWEKLARLVNGTLPGKKHKSLEIFVQQAHLEKILARAHDKLMLMTDGQYEFKRRLEEARTSTVTGLGIDVVDHTNESIRPVDTLSGGESFAAALALSLAVADEIQSS
ncbi:MAG: AAA family ATPase, partial [Phascolarctobacterium sp.]